MNLESLDYKEFEALVGMLLTREGLHISRTPKAGQTGPDFEVVRPDGQPAIVEVKHLRRTLGVPAALVDQFIGEVLRFREQAASGNGARCSADHS